jgi:hypothetical protein
MDWLAAKMVFDGVKGVVKGVNAIRGAEKPVYTRGRLETPDGDVYEGEIKYDPKSGIYYPHGQGVMTRPMSMTRPTSWIIYEGEFYEGAFIKGTKKFRNPTLSELDKRPWWKKLFNKPY